MDPFPSLSLSLSLSRARVRSGLRSFAVRPPAPSPFFTFHPSPEYTWNIYLFSLAISPIFPNRKISRFPRFPSMPILASFSRVDMTTSRFLSRSAGTTSCNPVVYPHYNCLVCRVNVSLGRSHSSCVLMYVLILDAENRPSWVGARRAASFTGKKAEQAEEKRHRRGYRDEEGRQPLVRRGRAFEARGAVPRQGTPRRSAWTLHSRSPRSDGYRRRGERGGQKRTRAGVVPCGCGAKASIPRPSEELQELGGHPASSSSWGVDHGGEQAGSKASADGNRQAGLHH